MIRKCLEPGRILILNDHDHLKIELETSRGMYYISKSETPDCSWALKSLNPLNFEDCFDSGVLVNYRGNLIIGFLCN